MSDGKWGRCFDDIKDDMAKCAESLLYEIKNYLKEEEMDTEGGVETLYDIKGLAEGIITEAEFILNKEYDE